MSKRKQPLRIDSSHIIPVDHLSFGKIEQHARTLEMAGNTVYRSKVRIFGFSGSIPWETVSIRRPEGWVHLVQDHEYYQDIRQLDADDLVDAVNYHIAEKYPHFKA